MEIASTGNENSSDLLQELSGIKKMVESPRKKQEDYESNYEQASTHNLDLHDQKTQSFNNQGTDLVQLAKQLNSLEVKLNNLERKIKVYDEKIDEMEQYSRSNCLIFHGV